MAHGNYLSLEKVHRMKRLDQFAKEHPSTSDEDAFDDLFDAMAEGTPPAKRRTSNEGTGED